MLEETGRLLDESQSRIDELEAEVKYNRTMIGNGNFDRRDLVHRNKELEDALNKVWDKGGQTIFREIADAALFPKQHATKLVT